MKFLQVLKVWWSFIWRYVGTMFILGSFYGIFFGGTEADGNLLGIILSIPVSILYFYYVLNKYFKEKTDE